MKKIFYRIIKRLFDIICSIIGIIFLIPIIIIVKIINIINKNYSSIFFIQKRIGLNGKEFNMFKLKTMVDNADEILEELMKKDSKIRREYKENKKLRHDPRVTKIGRILRRTSMDELPQLVNVFLGNMSIIGNRPYLPREKKDMGKYYKDIVLTKPGITGLWQTSGRSSCSFISRCKMESYYSLNASLTLDIKIFFKTALFIFKGM